MYIDTVELQADLRHFARVDGTIKTRRQELTVLISKIKNAQDVPSFEPDDNTVGRNTELNQLIFKTIRGLYNESEGDPVISPFTGEIAVSVTSNRGEIITRYEDKLNPYAEVGAVHSEYGAGDRKTLLPYAFAKGVQRLTLELAGRSGGIVKRENRNYLERQLPNVLIYEGDAIVHLLKDGGVYAGDFWVIGVSGAQITEAFLDRITGGHVSEHGLELFAGMMDSFAAESIATKIRYPHLEILPIPQRITDLVRSH